MKINATITGISFTVETNDSVKINGVLFETVKVETAKSEDIPSNNSRIVCVSNFVSYQKIQGIKAIREASGLGLKDSKELIEIIQFQQAEYFQLECFESESARIFKNRMNELGFTAEFY